MVLASLKYEKNACPRGNGRNHKRSHYDPRKLLVTAIWLWPCEQLPYECDLLNSSHMSVTIVTFWTAPIWLWPSEQLPYECDPLNSSHMIVTIWTAPSQHLGP